VRTVVNNAGRALETLENMRVSNGEALADLAHQAGSEPTGTELIVPPEQETPQPLPTVPANSGAEEMHGFGEHGKRRHQGTAQTRWQCASIAARITSETDSPEIRATSASRALCCSLNRTLVIIELLLTRGYGGVRTSLPSDTRTTRRREL
jgi:hypothetical protein